MAPHGSPKRKERRKQTCLGCGSHAALFRVNGRVKADRDHDLCPRCARSLRNRLRAQALSAAA